MDATILPTDIPYRFLYLLNQVVEAYEENLIPVLRGSLLLHYWFGEDARPVGDLDIECFQGPRIRPVEDEDGEEDEERWVGDGFGQDGVYESLVDFGKAMCRYAASSSQSYLWRRNAAQPDIEFQATENTEGGDSLWTYGTPGERYFAGWIQNRHGGISGRLQIDIASAGNYTPEDISITPIALPYPDGKPVNCPAYPPETLLAAKLSWLIRSLNRTTDGDTVTLTWTGEPKDLFDSHLLLTRADLRPDIFQKSLLAIGAQDNLNWNHLESIMAIRYTPMKDTDFANWPAFQKAHRKLTPIGPVEMLHTIADRLEPLLGDFYQRDEMPFILAIHADMADELPYLVYADWLDEHAHPDRSRFLRQYTRFDYHGDDLPAEQTRENLLALRGSIEKMSRPWLVQVFGTSAQWRAIQERIEGGM